MNLVSFRTQAECKLPHEIGSRAGVDGNNETEFSTVPMSERATHGSMDDLFSEETRGERPTTVAPPGRTYECEVRNEIPFLHPFHALAVTWTYIFG